jgi:8-oxo-dGTP pyrophosphatase MutT (NUDIX family)
VSRPRHAGAGSDHPDRPAPPGLVTRWANADGGRDIAAAGGVLWRPATGDGLTPGTPAAAGIPAAGAAVEVAIVHRQRYDDWSLPKGKLADGEHPLLAACR